MKTFIYIGDGAGVPGLPHVIAEEEAALFNSEQAQALKDALASGAYAEVSPVVKSKKKKAKDSHPEPEAEEGA